MADDLDDNFLLDDSSIPNSRESMKANSIDHSDQHSKKKSKRLNITQLLKIKENKFSEPDFSRNEFMRLIIEHMNKKLSNVEKNALNLNGDDSIARLDKYMMKNKAASAAKKANKSVGKRVAKKFATKLDAYLKTKKCKRLASPFMVILCSSAMRCIELQKDLSERLDGFKSKKLNWFYAFAKHKKLGEQIEMIRKSKKPLNVIYATPQRFAQLTADGEQKEENADDDDGDGVRALRLNSLKYVLIDYEHRDCKQKRIVDIPEVKNDLLNLLFGRLLPLNKEKIKLKFCLI